MNYASKEPLDDILFREAFQSAGHGMAVVTLDSRFQAVNDALCAMVGYGPSEFLKLRFHDITHPDDLEQDLAYVGQLLAGEIPSYEMEKRYRRKDGNWIDIRLNVALMRSDSGEPLYFIAHIIDVTPHKAAVHALTDSNRRFKDIYARTIETISKVIEKRDLYTAGHQSNVATIAKRIAQELGLDQETTEAIHLGALLHDVGKVYVPSVILVKPAKLTDNERALVEEHPTIGYEILRQLDLPWPVAEIVLQHHERENGSGYPKRLSGSAIRRETKVVAVADVFDSIYGFRPYRAALGMEKALAEITGNSGTLYDPDVVGACQALAARNALDLPAYN